MMIMTRQEARDANLNRYFTGKPCINGHICERRVTGGHCMICLRARVSKATKSGGRQRQNWLKRSKKRIKYSQSPSMIAYRLAGKLRRRLWFAVKNKTNKVGSAVRDLGCSIVEFRDHIAAQFQSGMTWDNHGEWHLDHKKPLASFNLIDREQFLQAVHYTNIQPLWAAENASKGAKL